jgi:hypothetical protein
MFNLVFAGPPESDDDNEFLVACENQLRPLVEEIVQAAVTAGWRRDDVLLRLVDVSWALYEQRGRRPM